MTLRAYKLVLDVADGVDMESDLFESAVDAARTRARDIINLLGGDPLPREQVVLTASTRARALTLVWRSDILAPYDKNLRESIRDAAAELDDYIQSWALSFHTCGNGMHKPCGKWQLLEEG